MQIKHKVMLLERVASLMDNPSVDKYHLLQRLVYFTETYTQLQTRTITKLTTENFLELYKEAFKDFEEFDNVTFTLQGE